MSTPRLPTAPTPAQRLARGARQALRPACAARRWLLQRLLTRLRGTLVLLAVLAAMALVMDRDYQQLVLSVNTTSTTR